MDLLGQIQILKSSCYQFGIGSSLYVKCSGWGTLSFLQLVATLKMMLLIAFSENSFFRSNFVGPSNFLKSISATDTTFGTKIVFVIICNVIE